MAPNSKFIKTLLESGELPEDKKKLIEEAEFVKNSEESELPDSGGDPEAQMGQGGETPEEQPVETPSDAFSDKEVDILNVALQFYRDNPEHSIESKNEFSDMFQEEQYEELLSRLIAIADELND